MPIGHDHGSGTDLQVAAQTAVEVGGIEADAREQAKQPRHRSGVGSVSHVDAEAAPTKSHNVRGHCS